MAVVYVMQPAMSTDPQYTVFIRLPFPRGAFVDPPSVEWDASKDKALWKILSKASKNSDIDWDDLATKFKVTLAFLLQQAAWLYERQLLQVRAQMRKVSVAKSAAPSPIPGSITETITGGESMRRTGSGGGRVPSALSTRRDSPVPPKADSSTSTVGRVGAPSTSRAEFVNTATTARTSQMSPRPTNSHLCKTTARTMTVSPQRSPRPAPLSSPSSSGASSSSSSPVQSRFIRRPKFQANKPGPSEDGDDDEEDEPVFLPITAGGEGHHQDPSDTLRGEPYNIATRRTPAHSHTNTHKGKDVRISQTSDSSASSTAPHRRVEAMGGKKPGPLSPRRTAELAGRSPGKGREGSEGSPSMGSSFSDLDDASVTQSALEEALASNMQAGGGMASRMSSTISQALRSKYL
ncbi:hypothetical protein BJ878DRAFT_518039 [Calycina marina]|uniref:Autophagy-related protein 29 n=1 Tax=Calycina marina TaxID=1763456 RepID=A0A9P7YXT6_9HELO|nr:hypothetical protein BJ878DRAFT_518039 [Calycina marina]